MIRVAVLASGAGSTLGAILGHEGKGGWEVVLVVSDREGAGALEIGRRAGRRSEVVPFRGRDAAEAGEELIALLGEERVDLVVLAGFLRLVPAAVVSRFRGRILNVHPALLPAFGGKGMFGAHVHTAVLQSGVRISGTTVHWVDEEYDRGHAVAQWPVPVLEEDTPERLAARVQEVERALYPRVLDHVAKRLAAGGAVTPFPLPAVHFILARPTPGDDPVGRLFDGMGME